MTDGGDGTDTSGVTVEEAFGLLGNEIRADILRVLGETPHAGITVPELRDRIDGDVDGGEVNHHLQQLVGPLVADTDDGYVLRDTGLSLYRAIRAGTFTRMPTVEPFPAGFDCYFCGASVEAAYREGTFRLRCPGCDHLYTSTSLPPSAVEGADEPDLLARVDRYNRYRMQLAASGVCPVCVNPMDGGFVPAEAGRASGAERLDVFVHRSCGHCGREQRMPVGLALLTHPTLVSFCYDHGIDLTSVDHWELEFVLTDENTTVRSRDPWEVAVAVTIEGLTLEMVVDEDLDVVETNRY